MSKSELEKLHEEELRKIVMKRANELMESGDVLTGVQAEHLIRQTEQQALILNDIDKIKETLAILEKKREDIHEKIDSLRNDMDSKIDSLRNDMDSKIDSLRNDMDSKIDSLRNDMDSKIDALRGDIQKVLNFLMKNIK